MGTKVYLNKGISIAGDHWEFISFQNGKQILNIKVRMKPGFNIFNSALKIVLPRQIEL